MNAAVEARIRGLLEVGKPTQEQADGIVAGWDRLFRQLHLEDQQEAAEFNGIMKARVQSGVTSLVAPTRIREDDDEA